MSPNDYECAVFAEIHHQGWNPHVVTMDMTEVCRDRGLPPQQCAERGIERQQKMSRPSHGGYVPSCMGYSPPAPGCRYSERGGK